MSGSLDQSAQTVKEEDSIPPGLQDGTTTSTSSEEVLPSFKDEAIQSIMSDELKAAFRRLAEVRSQIDENGSKIYNSELVTMFEHFRSQPQQYIRGGQWIDVADMWRHRGFECPSGGIYLHFGTDKTLSVLSADAQADQGWSIEWETRRQQEYVKVRPLLKDAKEQWSESLKSGATFTSENGETQAVKPLLLTFPPTEAQSQTVVT